jgi:hypothetical protein
LAATLKSAGLLLDVDTANAQIGRWLQEIAHQRIHGTTGEKPQVRLEQERHAFLPLPAQAMTSLTSYCPVGLKTTVAMPYESLQHPLSVYDALLGAPV